jgi:hypothetical protein
MLRIDEALKGPPSRHQAKGSSVIHPPIYPWSAFDDRRFLSAWSKPILPEQDGPGRNTVHATSEVLRQRLLSEYNRVAYEVVGILQGDYGVGGNGMMLYDRGGACISINFPIESSALSRMPYEQANDDLLRLNRAQLYEDWDNVPVIQNAAIFSSIYHTNYYHYTFEFLQKFRLIRDLDVQNVLLPAEALDAPFKRDLVTRAAGHRALFPTSHAVRVFNPVIVQAHQSAEGISWLRGLFETNAEPGGRKYYVRRNPAKARLGSNIAESAAFLQMLNAYDFTIIDFGNGENSIQDQIHMLDGASVILTAHGAGLTNLTYLRPPIRVLEVFGPAVLSTSFMRISTVLGFDHHVIISNDLNEDGDIVVDCEQIAALLSA